MLYMYLYKVKNNITRTLVLGVSSSDFTVDLEEGLADWKMRHHKLVIVNRNQYVFLSYFESR